MSHSTNSPQRFEPVVAELALPDADLLAGDLAVARCADPFEQWLRWEERANLVGFRMTMEPVALEVSAPRDGRSAPRSPRQPSLRCEPIATSGPDASPLSGPRAQPVVS